MTDDEEAAKRKVERIAAARAALAARAEADPEAVQRVNARLAKLDQARKRERQRFEHLVLGNPRAKTDRVTTGKRKGKRVRISPPAAKLDPEVERGVELRERWSHKANATAETMEAASRTHQGALAQLHANGTITNDQLEWAAEIANVHRSIASDVEVAISSLEARVDQSRSSGHLAGESVRRVRLHLAYGYWRDQLPAPKALVLDMIVGDHIGYSVAAARYRVHKRKAKRLLLDAIDAWPRCVDRAYKLWTHEEIAGAARAAA